MKKLLLTLLIFIAAGCATPYQPAYNPADGSYYIPEATSLGYGYGGGISYWNYGFYPWWSTAGYYGYTSYPFFYYSPYFYPHYFSVWSPDWHHSHYTWGRSWRPPYRYAKHDPVTSLPTPANPSEPPVGRVVAPLPIRSYKAYPLPSRGPRSDPDRFPGDSVVEPAGSAAAANRSWPSAGAARNAASSPAPAPRSSGLSPPASRSVRSGGGYRSAPRRASTPSQRVRVPRDRFSKRDGQ
jgi:hypothetical protein